MSQSHVNDEGFREFVAGRYGDLLRTAYLLTGGRQSAMRDLYALPTCLCRSYRYTDGMRQPTYFILAALQDGPLHGYAIISRVDDLSGGQTKLATGTLYAALDRLTSEGYVRMVNEEVVNGRARRYYELTPEGGDGLRAEAERLAAAARIVTEHRVAARRSVRSKALPA
jgi:PadR family transcriptional regulator PadR